MEEMPSIQQMECFIIYGRVQNFSQAAREANITQSAFSAQIKKLEASVGVPLIERSYRGSHLTPMGEKFLAQCTTWMTNLHEMVYQLRREAEADQAPLELNVGILRSLGDIQMNRHVAYFQKNNSRLRLNVFDIEEGPMRDALLAGRIDVASTYLSDPQEFHEFTSVHFCWDELVYYAPKLSLGNGPVSREQMAELPMVCYQKNNHMNEAMQRYFREANLEPRLTARLSTPYAMLFYCQQNEAGVLLPERLLHAVGCEEGWYPLTEPLRADACLIYRKDNPKRESIEAYIRYVLHCYDRDK